MATHTEDPEVQRPEQQGSTQQIVPHEPPTPQGTASSITELQSVFGTLLCARKTPNEPWVPGSYKRKAIKPRWTGAFALFSLPREIRDRIYYHYLMRHKPVIFSLRSIRGRELARAGNYSNRVSQTGAMYFDKSDQIVSLYCTNKQVFQEAVQVFFRYNVIEIRGRTLQGTFHHFPDSCARLVQRLTKCYNDGRYGYIVWVRPSWLSPDDMFSQMIRDAHFHRSFLPRLREYTIEWYAWPPYFAEHGLRFTGASEEEKIDIWYDWIMGVVEYRKLVPASWIKIKMARFAHAENGMLKHERALQEAWTRAVKETAGAGDEDRILEESKRLWLEELESKQQRKKGKKQLRREKLQSVVPAT